MENSRRKFLKAAGVSVLGVGTLSLLNGIRPHNVTAQIHSGGEFQQTDLYRKTPEALRAKRWGMVVDTRKVTHQIIKKMRDVCDRIHNIPDHKDKKHEIKWIWEAGFEEAFPIVGEQYLVERLENAPIPVLCNHCDNPPCVRACPTQATFKREDGIVMMDFHRCIGCRFCMAACPFGSRSFNFVDPVPDIQKINESFPTRMRGVVEKCDFCAERLAVGKEPACVEASEGVLVFGDLSDPASEVRKLLKENFTIRRKPSLGTNPSVYYLV